MSMVGDSKTANGSGTLTFGAINAFSGATALQDFLAGTVDSSTVLVGDPSIHAEQPRYAVFAQDDWRLTPKLTLNLGFRTEIVPPITEPQGKIGGFDPTAPEGLVQQGIQVSTLWRTRYNVGNFAPRVGFAYDLTGARVLPWSGLASAWPATLTILTALFPPSRVPQLTPYQPVGISLRQNGTLLSTPGKHCGWQP